MGLGLNGGGLEAARFLASRGTRLTVTDLRGPDALLPSITALDAFVRETGAPPVRYVLGRHEITDFQNAGLVVKNPGVRPDSPFLRAARRIETDISLFLRENPARLLAVTGSKGKSFTASAIHYGLNAARARGLLPGGAWLGGNITVSPLSFLGKLGPDDDVVLELSSWQLADLLLVPPREDGRPLFKPRVAVLTAIMSDHQNWYGSMEAYVNDKRIIYRWQDQTDATIAGDDSWGASFRAETRGRPYVYAAATGSDTTMVSDPAAYACLVPARPAVVGAHQKRNLHAAALALFDLGLPPEFIRETLAGFGGIEHRLEFFHEKNGIRFYNDTAATIPEAAAAALEALNHPVLVAGGTDKNLDFTPLAAAAPLAKAIVLLAGTGSAKLIPLLDAAGAPYSGPFDKLGEALSAALARAAPGDTVVLSPGCTSFGMFQNEFDRGRQWKAAVFSL
jgi:UDP-N-acetylmuramoylalanine--D-glutamate ligase